MYHFVAMNRLAWDDLLYCCLSEAQNPHSLGDRGGGAASQIAAVQGRKGVRTRLSRLNCCA
jgi:hypothetical protein